MIDWIDFDLPEDWNVIPIKDIAATIRSGGTPRRGNPEFWGGDIPFALIEDITSSGTYLTNTNEKISQSGLANSSAWLVPKGAVLLTMYATIGATAINAIPLATNQAILAIVPKPEYASEFLAYALNAHKTALSARNVQATQKNINKGIVESFLIPVPPFAEQRRIAHVLSTVQTAVEQQERLIALTRELKSALMHKLFTEGVRGEKQKETEIGLVPESWDVKPLESVIVSLDYGTSVKCDYVPDGFPVLRIPNVVGGSIDTGDLKRGALQKNEIEKLRLMKGDLLFVRTNGVQSNAGRCSIFNDEVKDCYFASYLIRVRLDTSQLIPEFLNEFSRTEIGKSLLSGRAVRTADGKYNINSGTIKSILVPVPDIDEQREIAQKLTLIEQKTSLHSHRQSLLQELFRTLLYQLMTCQVRVNDIELTGVD